MEPHLMTLTSNPMKCPIYGCGWMTSIYDFNLPKQDMMPVQDIVASNTHAMSEHMQEEHGAKMPWEE